MGIKRYKPTSAGMRWKTTSTFEEVTKHKPEKSLTTILRKSGGRNNQGHITLRFRGGGHKRRYRIIDFKRDKHNLEAKVIAIEYDPNRNARIALVQYTDNEKRYILQPVGLSVGDTVVSGKDVEIKIGNAMPLAQIPAGTVVHNIELYAGKGAEVARSAGAGCQIMAKEGDIIHVKMPSGEIRLFRSNCFATIGQVGNIDHEAISIGKAGRSRWMGFKPHVRGVVMNPVDHPHGGGEGKSGQGNPHPVTPWGIPTKGYKTRKRKKYSAKYILKRRK